MDISEIIIEPPSQAELAARTPEEKMWCEFDFFYESGEPHFFELDNGTKVTFGNNRKESAWNLLINHNIVLTTDDAEEIITKALEYN